jgi:plastocyanin
MEGKEVTKMTKKLMVFFLALAVAAAISLPSFAQNNFVGKVEALDKAGNKITINGSEYSLSYKAAQVNVKVGDMVRATVEGNTVTTLAVMQ